MPIFSSKKSRYTFLLLLLAVLAVAFRVWVSTPTWLHYDENYYINIAQSYAARGELTPYMWRLGDAHIITGGGSGYAVLILIGWLRAFNFSLFAGRTLMALAGLLASLVMFKVAAAWWHSRTAGWAALVFGLAATAPFYTLILKMDALAVLSYTLVLWLFVICLENQNRWLHLLLGAACVLTFEFHVLGALYLLALTAYFVFDYAKQVVARRRILFNVPPVYFALGAFIAGIVYLAVHVFPDPKAYFIISQQCFECRENLLVTEFKRIVRLLYLRPHEVLIFILIVIAAFKRGRHEDRRFLIVTGAYLVAQSVTHTPPYDHYSNHMWPLLALGAGGFVAGGFNHLPSLRRVNVSLAAAFVILFANLGLHLLGAHPYLISYDLKSTPAVDAVLRSVPKDTVVMAKVPDFYLLRDYPNFLSYKDGSAYGASLRGEDMLSFWRRTRPEVILLEPEEVDKDSELTQYIHESGLAQVMPGLWADRSLGLAP